MLVLTLGLVVVTGLLVARSRFARAATIKAPVTTPTKTIARPVAFTKPGRRSLFGGRVGFGFLSQRGGGEVVVQREQIQKLTNDVARLRHARGDVRLSLEPPWQLPNGPTKTQDARDLYYYDSWVPHPGTAISPSKILGAFREAELGYPQLMVDLLDDLIEGDAHARNLFEHRERLVAKAPLAVTATAGDKESANAANALDLAFKALPWKQAAEQLLRVHRYGFGGLELTWDVLSVKAREWIVPTRLTIVPARRFRIGTQGMVPVREYPDGTPTLEANDQNVRYDELRLYQDLRFPQGHPLRPGKWLTLRRQTSQVARGGLGRTAALLLMGKRFSFRDWLILSERYGIPWPIAKYETDADQSVIDIAKQIVANIGNDGGAAIPNQLELEIKEGVQAKTPVQQTLSAWCNNELSKLINGSTLRNDSTGSGGASYGLGNVHDAVAWDEVRADGELLSEALIQQIALPFMQFNGLTCATPQISIVVEPDMGPQEGVAIGVKLKDELGIEVSQSQLRKLTGFRDPLNDADKAPGMQVQSFPTPAGGPPK